MTFPPSSRNTHSPPSTGADADHRPRIFFLQRSVPPDHSAAGAILLDLARHLARRGFSPWLLATREPKKAPRREFLDGVQIVRAACLRFSKSSLLFRALTLLSAYVSLAITALRLPRPDVIVTLTDPPLALCLGNILARIWSCPHFHWSQDVYPEIARAAGLLSANGIFYRSLHRIARHARRRADRVIVIGRCMEERLRGDCEKNLCLIPNWSQLDYSIPLASTIRTRLQAEKTFLVLYTGNLGRTHDFDGLLAAATEFQALDEPVVFGIVGNGPQRAEVERRATAAQLVNVRFLPPQPWNEVPSMLAAADILLVSLKSEFGGLVVPSKIYDATASGRPVIFAGPADCECARVLADYRLGVTVPDRDGHALAQAIRSVRSSNTEFPEHSQAAARSTDPTSIDLFEQALREALLPASLSNAPGTTAHSTPS